jgi:hypothetical protein
MPSYFPIKIQIMDSKHPDFGRTFIMKSPHDIPSGVSFKVVETKVVETKVGE